MSQMIARPVRPAFRTARATVPQEVQKAELMSLNRVQFCVGRLETARLAISKETDVEHVQRLRRRYGTDA